MITSVYALGIGMKQKEIKPQFNKKKNESHEYILKDLSFQILWLSSWIIICLQTEFYKKINISMVDIMLE